MKSWLLRGLVFAALMVLVRLVQGALINTWETQALPISVFLVVAFALVALVWGLLDGRADAAAEPDPDRRADLAMTWLIAGLVAGALSGAVTWFISLFYKTIYVEALLNELTTFAAFTALVTFVSATIGVTLGRWLSDRQAERHGVPVGRHRTDDIADTDVFAAVSGERASGEGSEPTTEPQRIQSEEGPEGHAAR
jgi:MFS family permease